MPIQLTELLFQRVISPLSLRQARSLPVHILQGCEDRHHLPCVSHSSPAHFPQESDHSKIPALRYRSLSAYIKRSSSFLPPSELTKVVERILVIFSLLISRDPSGLQCSIISMHDEESGSLLVSSGGEFLTVPQEGT
ncbi:hypothetical protein Mapa_017150 [Marchantia paleacea]|nr:hypothetical protein Mapa_017150 [Marchantia paleacea]